MVQLHICTRGDTCPARGSCELAVKLKQTVESLGLGDRVQVCEEGCMGLCSSGPNIIATPQGKQHHEVTESDLVQIVQDAVASEDNEAKD